MPTTGWRITFTADLQHRTSVIAHRLAWLPGWATTLLLLAALAGVLTYVLRTNRSTSPQLRRGAPADTQTAAAEDAGGDDLSAASTGPTREERR